MNRKDRRTATARSRSGNPHRTQNAAILYVARREHLYTMQLYLERWGQALRDHVRPVAYESLLQLDQAPRTAFIFSDIERLPPEMADHAARIWARMSTQLPPGALLNHPQNSMKRYQLLRTLHRSGVNRFDVMRLTEERRPARYPVFIRPENEHLAYGQQLPLLADADQLDAALRYVREHGIDVGDFIITEWLDTADAVGIHRKYGAFCVGARVLPRHLMFSRNWIVKEADLMDEALLAEERRYVEANPHANEIRKIFATARIDYGRIDYWIDGDGKLQVWEINTNPMVATGGHTGGSARDALTASFSTAFNAAILDWVRGLAW